jgi:phage terminase large subunit
MSNKKVKPTVSVIDGHTFDDFTIDMPNETFPTSEDPVIPPGVEQFTDSDMFDLGSFPSFRPTKLETIQNCPRCGKPLVPAKAINGGESDSFKECPNCGTLINLFKPTPFQAAFLRRRERYKMTAGGFGSGKSRATIEDVIKHILLIKNARVCVAARTYPALDSTFVKEFYSRFPEKLVKRKNDQKHEISFTNGAEIIFRSFDDETKLKSMNLTMAVVIEASDVSYAAFNMLQSRIRNSAALIPELDSKGDPVLVYDPVQKIYRPKHRVDVRHIDLETNPDSGWVKSKFLLDAATVEFFGDAYNEGYRFHKNPDPHKYVQVVSTSANPYLPTSYEEEQSRGKSLAYIQQYYKGSFNFSSNLVFPNFGVCIVPPHELPRRYNEDGRQTLYCVIGLDYGINDPTHIVFGAYSVETKKLYVYDELRLNNSDVKTIAKEYRRQIKINNTDLDALLMLPRFDGRSYSKRESSLVTIGGMFEAEGLYFEPSFATHEARIIKLNALINHDQIEVFSTCEFLCDEMLNYKFKVDKNGQPTSTPVDGNDHGITALEFIVVELPHNLKELRLSAYLPTGAKIIHDKRKDDIIKKGPQVFDPLKEDVYVRTDNGFGNNMFVTGSDPSKLAHRVHNETFEDDKEDDEQNTDYASPLQAYIPR